MPAVGAEARRGDLVFVALEDERLTGTSGVPNPRRTVHRGRDDALAVAAEARRGDLGFVAAEDELAGAVDAPYMRAVWSSEAVTMRRPR